MNQPDHNQRSHALRKPEPGDQHYPFYRALLEGKRVWRDDKLNKVQEWLTLSHPQIDGKAENILFFGCNDLKVEDDCLPEPAAKVLSEMVWLVTAKLPVSHTEAGNRLWDAFRLGIAYAKAGGRTL